MRDADFLTYEKLAHGIRGCGIVLLDIAGRVAIWSDGASLLQGYSSKETVGITYAFFFSNADIVAGKPEKLLKMAVECGNAEDEGWRYRKDGSRFWAKVMVSVLRDKAGRPRGFAAVTYDISRQKYVEDMLKTAKESAEAANRAKTAFLANMSHEIRTPLGAVLGFAELLSDPKLTQMEREEYITTIQRSGSQLLSLINDVLDLSKIEADRLELEILEFDFRAFLKDLQSLAKAEMIARRRLIRISVECDPGVPAIIKSDPVRMRQIIINLVANAIKFTHHGSVELHVSLDSANSAERSATWLSIRVADTGVGMSREQQQNIFQAFSQADGTIARKYGGTGLGLVLARKIARQMGGDLVLESSEPERGSTFKVTLPVHGSAGLAAASPAASAPTDWEAGVDLTGVKVLVVEDCVENQLLIKRFLNLANAEVSVANNGREAVDLALNGLFDVVLMDIQMPEMDGREATQRLRQENFLHP
ncbi:MAG: hypothetical protein C5B49_08380, partial [Bdellovibrio sp.]